MARKSAILLFVILLILFVSGIFYVFSIRFRVGDIYPPYSSLRSDPLGTKILYEGLSALSEYDVSRNYRQLSMLKGDTDTTLFIPGLHFSVLEYSDKETFNTLSEILSSGTRVVISLNSKSARTLKKTLEGKKDEKTQDNTEEDDKEDDYLIMKKWGVETAFMVNMNNIHAWIEETPAGYDLPPRIKFPSSFYFKNLSDKWVIHYSINDLPVIISANLGKGTVILCADSYILSNEAMMADRYHRLLAWLAGSSKTISFDESHFGIQKNTGIINLVYRFRLQGIILVFLAISILYVWKNAGRLVPPHKKSFRNETVIRSEKNYLDGLISLLQRNIPEEDLSGICISEWEASRPSEAGYRGSDILSSKDMVEIADTFKSPVGAYNSISQKLLERKRL
jgi:hypothetical protein